jgi:hypothetical protein
MDSNQPQIDYGDEVFTWPVPEFEKHNRPKSWYIGGIALGIILILLSIITPNYFFDKPNFLFAVIIIIGALVLIMNDGREPHRVKFSITDEGLMVGKKFIDFDELKNFSVVYKPRQNIKNLYFEFKSSLKYRLSIPLLDMNPLPIREYLLKYLAEDLERTDKPLSEGLAKLFKL